MVRKFFILISLVMWVGFACTIGTPIEQIPTPLPGTRTPTPTLDPAGPEATFTAIAQTVVADITTAAQTPTLTPTRTRPPTLTPLDAPTATPTKTITPSPTTTPLPTFTPALATATPTTTCNAARFVADVNVTGGSTFSPKVPFIKIWRVENAGSCTWTLNYALVYFSGERMNGKRTNFLTSPVKPGDTMDLAVTLEAPGSPNTYQGFWMLQSPDGKMFGVGTNYDVPLSVNIEVLADEPSQFFNFAVNACAAVWTNENGPIPCPGTPGDENGFIRTLFEPGLENQTANQPALWMFPKKEEKGWISGTFPGLLIQAGDQFIADVGCLDNSPKCNLTLQLEYRVKGTAAVVMLGQWEETFDGEITSVALDLSPLAGQEVEFIFTVKARASPDDDNAFWLSPHIRR